MSEPWVDAFLDVLRRDGSVVVPVADVGDVEQWRRTVRRACRDAGLRIRTGVTGSGVVWAHHVDHVGTEAELQAAAIAVDNYLSGKPRRPFHELVREEQRKRLSVVNDEADRPPNVDRRTPPGNVDLLIIEYSSRQHAFDVDEDRFLQNWYANIALTNDNGDVVEKVGYVLAHVLGYEELPNPFVALDGETADLGHIAGAIFDPVSGKMRSEVEELLEPAGFGMLIIDSVRLEPSWRGYGLGPLLVGMVIEQLGDARQFVALHAAPAELRNAAGERVEEISDADRHAASVKLGDHWAQLGFEPISDDVWILALGVTTFPDRMSDIRDRFGLT